MKNKNKGRNGKFKAGSTEGKRNLYRKPIDKIPAESRPGKGSVEGAREGVRWESRPAWSRR